MEVTATLVSIISFVDGVEVKGAYVYNYLNLTKIFDRVWYAFPTQRQKIIRFKHQHYKWKLPIFLYIKIMIIKNTVLYLSKLKVKTYVQKTCSLIFLI